MAKCGKSGACPCMCNVKQKRKPTVRRPPPARVYKGTTATAPGADIYSLVRLVSDLTAKKVEQSIIPPAATIGIPEAAKNIKPMVSSTSGTLSSSVGTETTPEIRTYGTQTYGMGIKPRITAPAGISVGTDARPESVSVGTDARPESVSAAIQTIKQRATPYKSGFLSILPEAQKAKNIGERAIEMATPAISQKALESKVFTQTTIGRGVETFGIADLEQRLAAGQTVAGRGGRPSNEELARRAALQAAAEAAEQSQP